MPATDSCSRKIWPGASNVAAKGVRRANTRSPSGKIARGRASPERKIQPVDTMLASPLLSRNQRANRFTKALIAKLTVTARTTLTMNTSHVPSR